MLTAFALAAASSFALFVFVHYAAQHLRVGALVDLVGDELRGQLQRRYPGESGPGEDASVLLSHGAGNVIHGTVTRSSTKRAGPAARLSWCR